MAAQIILWVFLIITWVYFYMTRKFNYWKSRGIPYIEPIPIFGNILDICLWRESIGTFCKTIYEKSREPLLGFFMFDEPCLLVSDLDVIKNIIIKDFDYFMNRTMTNNEKHDGVGSNILFLMKTPKWKNVRRRMTPAFSSGKMKLMSYLMKECAEQMIEYVDDILKKNEILEVRELCAKYTTNTITSTSYGLDAQCFKYEDAPFRVIARRIYNWRMIWHAIQTSCFFLAPQLVTLFRMSFIDNVSTKFFRNVFWKAMNERQKTKIVRNDLLDILIEMRAQEKIENTESLDGDVLVAQAAQFFIAGYETTSSTMSFMLFELARNPDVQKKLRQEIVATRNQFGTFSYDCLQSMEYFESAIMETLRKYPIVPFLDRRCTKSYKIPEYNLTLQKEDMVYIATMGIQYDEKYFPEPHLFNPDRFHKSNCQQRHSMTFLAFGDGPRNCIGRRYALLNAKFGLAHLLYHYEFESCDSTEMKLSPRGFLLQPDKALKLRVKRLT